MARTWVGFVLAFALGFTTIAGCGGGKGGSTDAGMSSSAQVCVGTPVACGLLSPSQCAAAAGCAPGACSGAAAACSGFGSETECLLQQGCAPSGGSACGGAALACLAFSAETECRAQRGCAWQAGCAGRAAACGSLNAAACAAQPGCHLESGSPADGAAPVDTGVPPGGDCPDAGVPAVLVIDDMEDQTQEIVGSVAYGGWYVYHDDTSGAHMTPEANMPFMMEPIPGGRCASEYAMRMSGTGFMQWGAGMGFDFGYGNVVAGGPVVKIPTDARAYAGMRFWARVGQATNTRVTFSIGAGSCPRADAGAGAAGTDGGNEDAGGDDAGVADAGAADAPGERPPGDCAQPFAKPLTLTTDWVRYDIAFDELVSSVNRQAIPRDQIYSVQFLVPGSTTFDLWVDDISWIPAAAAAP